MNNPFEVIEDRLNNIESLLISIKETSSSFHAPESDQPITTKQLCAFLGVTEPTVIRWRKKGKVPFLKIGSRILYQKSAVIAALEGNKKGELK